MSFTANSDLYAAIHDGGINRVIRHLMRKRPSLFNYGTLLVQNNPQLLCERIDVAPEVIDAGNPLVSIMDPLPVIATPFSLNFCAQLSEGQIDFFPSNVFSLPSELGTNLASQNFAIYFKICAGIGCPPKEIVSPNRGRFAGGRILESKSILEPLPTPKPLLEPLPTSKLECFCLKLYATGSTSINGPVGNQIIVARVGGIEIVDIQPEGIENSIECYALLALNQGILPQIGNSISSLAFGVINLPESLGTIRISAATSVPNNPAIEEDQLKAFINIEELILNIPFPLPGGGGGGGGGVVTRTTRPRTRNGIFDFTAALSKVAVQKFFGAVVQGFRFSKADSGSWGPFSAAYHVEAHLEDGSIELRNNGTIKVTELDIKWDVLHLDLGFNIPEFCIGGFCLIPPGAPDFICVLHAPRFCLFSENPDISIPLDLSGIITSEITFTFSLRVFYGIGSGVPNRWQIVIVPTLPFDLDIIDIEETIGDLVDNIISSILTSIFGDLPDWAVSLVEVFLDGVLRPALDLFDDAGEWLIDALTQLGVFDFILNALDNYLANLVPPIEVEDPFEVLPADPPLIPVKVPIEFIGIQVNSNEAVIQGDIGD